MNRSTITFLLILRLIGFAFQVSGQRPGTIELGPAPESQDTATNVAIGKYSIMATYPNVEFILDAQQQHLLITVIDESGLQPTQVIPALIGQLEQWIYRADFINDKSWLELDASTGTTIIHVNCKTRVFTQKPSTQWQLKPNR
jgi:hypothetical protein